MNFFDRNQTSHFKAIQNSTQLEQLETTRKMKRFASRGGGRGGKNGNDKVYCPKCAHEGHHPDKCTYVTNKTVCYSCGKTGHRDTACYCIKCGYDGHHADYCVHVTAETVCHICDKKGHKAAACQPCYKCRIRGQFSRDECFHDKPENSTSVEAKRTSAEANGSETETKEAKTAMTVDEIRALVKTWAQKVPKDVKQHTEHFVNMSDEQRTAMFDNVDEKTLVAFSQVMVDVARYFDPLYDDVLLAMSLNQSGLDKMFEVFNSLKKSYEDARKTLVDAHLL